MGDDPEVDIPQITQDGDTEGEQIETGYIVNIEAEVSDGLLLQEATIMANGQTETEDLYNEQNMFIETEVEPKGKVNIILKAKVEEEIPASEVTNKISAVIKLANETGSEEDEEKRYVGRVEKEITYKVTPYIEIQEITIPEEIQLNIGETKPLEIVLSPEGASLEDVTISLENEEIATLTEDGKIKGVLDGITIVTVTSNNSEATSECVIRVVDQENPNEPGDPDAPGDGEMDDEPGQEKDSYIISGTAWLDENENGIMDSNEKLLKGILVKIKDNSSKEYLKDSNGNIISAITDDKGKYEFRDLPKGSYTIEFEYNRNTYKLTTGEGKDSAAHLVTADENTIVTTEAIEIIDRDIKNINIGLILNPIFDLQLDKYITKVTVQNSAGTKVYEYNKEQLAKIDIGAKKLNGSTVIIEYTIAVTNKGEIEGYAKNIVDYASSELKFNSEMNKDWYQGENNNLYYAGMANSAIKPGETKEVKLVLTKTMTNSNTGLVNNSAEIYRSYNEYAIEDINSSPDNKEEKENDYSSANIIITVSTGGAMLYVGIILGCMLVLGLGIYFINKKVINEKEII